MSLILDALKRAQQIKIEKKQQAQSFGTSVPWLPRWRKRWITPRKLLLPLGLTLAAALLFTVYKPAAHKPSEPVSQTVESIATLPIREVSEEELKPELARIPLEEVQLKYVSIPTSLKSDSTPTLPSPLKGEGLPARHRSRSGEAGGGGGEVPRDVTRTIPKSATPPAKPAESIREKPKEEQVIIQPIPSQQAISHFNLGLLYHKNRKLDDALEEYKKALDLDPLNVQSYNNLGMVYKELGRLPEAISQYQKALSINPNYEKAHHNLAVAYYLQGAYEKAVMEFKLALDCNPKNPETYNNLGLIYRKQKDLYRAKKIFAKALSIAPNYGPIHYNLALTLEDEGDWKAAVLHYRKFLDLAPDHQLKLAQKVKRHLEVLIAYEKQ